MMVSGKDRGGRLLRAGVTTDADGRESSEENKYADKEIKNALSSNI